MKAFDFSQFTKPWEKEQAFANLPDERYHNDIVAMSSGQLKKIMESPAHFKSACLAGPGEPTPAMRLGGIIHKAILEGPEFRRRYKIMPEFSGKGSKAAKEEWIAAHPGAIIISADEEQQIAGMLESVMAHPLSAALLSGCQDRIEISGFFNHQGVRCKMRADVWRKDDLIVDLKTTQSAAERDFMKDAWNLNYPIQASWYTMGAEKITKRRHDFAYIAVEKTPPYPVAVYTAGAAFLTAGEKLVTISMNRFHEAMKSGRFRAYSDQAQELQIPVWAMRDLEELDRVETTLYAS